MQDIIIPVVHLNGTSKESLLNGYLEVHRALISSLDKLSDAAPNGRDYYLSGTGAFEKAREQHDNRVKKLVLVKDEIEYIINSIYDEE